MPGRIRSKKCRLAILVAIVAATLVAGCGGGGGGTQQATPHYIYTLQEAQQPAKWTILVYLDGDNDLEDAGVINFNQMEAVGSTADVHVIVQFDRMTGDDPSNPWKGARRYLITHDTDSVVMHSLKLDEFTDLDSGNPQTLRDFVSWGKSEFPADHYLLVIWDHGSGWSTRALARPRYKDICSDDTSGSIMHVSQIPTALAGMHMDVIAFDACYMEQLEVAYELRGCADYMVGSCATEPDTGYNYTRVLQNTSGTTTPAQMCQTIVAQYAAEYPSPNDSITQSAVDLSKIADVASAANDLAVALEGDARTDRVALSDARTSALDYCTSGTDYHSLDLLDYSDRCATAVGSGAAAARSALQNALSAAVISSIHNRDMPSCHGLAVYAPPPSLYDPNYGLLMFSRDTAWDEWLQAQVQ